MSVITALVQHGMFLYPIIVMGVLTAAFIIERVFALYFKLKIGQDDFREKIVDCLRQGDLKAAQAISSTASDTILGRIAAVGCQLRAQAAGEEELQSRMDERLSHEIARIDRRVGFLAMFGNVATLLGLLGTVSGMIVSFSAISQANPAERAALLSRGISEAMNATALGLMVAVPALVAYAIFQNRIDRVVSEITQTTTRIYNDLLFLSQRTQPT